MLPLGTQEKYWSSSLILFGAFLFHAHAGIISVVEENLDGDTPAIIEPDGENADGTSFDEDVLAYSDTSHQHNGAVFDEFTGDPDKEADFIIDLPEYLKNNDYVRFASQARENVGYSATVTTDSPATFYLLIDNRLNGPAGTANNGDNRSDPVLGGSLQWVLDGLWERVNTGISPAGRDDYAGLDESGNGSGPGVGINQFFAIYRYPVSTTSIVVKNTGINGGANVCLVAAPDEGSDDAIVSFGAPQSPIDFGQSTPLRWAISPEATAATIEGIGDVLAMTNADGIGSIEVSPAVDTEYTLNVTADGDTDSATTLLKVRLLSSFESSDESVTSGDPVTLSWKVRPDAAISIDPGFPNLSDQTDETGAGSVQVVPTEDTVYTLTTTVGDDTATSQVSVEVLAAGSRFALIDIGPLNGRPEQGAAGGIQIGGGNANENGPNVPPTVITSDTGREFSIAIDNIDPNEDEIGRLDWRDRGDAEESDLTLLGEDFVKNNNGMIRVTLSNLPAGSYNVTSYHIDPGFDQCEAIQVLVTDANGVAVDTGETGDASVALGGVEFLETDSVNESAANFSITSDGTSDIHIYFDGTQAFDTEVPLNGLTLAPADGDNIAIALVDIGAQGGQSENDASGGQLGGGASGVNGPLLEPQFLEFRNGAEFTLAIDNLNPAGSGIGRIDWRDRGDAGEARLTRLAEDFLKNNNGMVRVVLGNLPKGKYEITSYHIDPGFSQCEAINILVTDADGVARETGVSASAFFEGEPPAIDAITTAMVEERSAIFTINADGENEVFIYFDGTAASDTEVPLNGLQIVASEGAGSQTILSFLAVPGDIEFGQKSTLRWVVDPSATAITIEPGIGDVMDHTADGSGTLEVSPSIDTVYTLKVTRTGAAAEATTTVGVKLLSTFTSETSFIEAGQSSILTWNVRPDAMVTLEPDIGDVSGETQADGSGQISVSPTQTTVYKLTATVGNVQVTTEFEVRVAPEPVGEPFALLDVGALDGDPEEGATGEEQIGGGNSNENGVSMDPVTLTSDTGVEFEIAIDAKNIEGDTIGGLDWRNRGFSLGEPLTLLAMDFVKNNLGVISVTLSNIPTGEYNVISYHVDPGFSQSEAIRIFITDANGVAVDTGVVADSSFAGDPPGGEITTAEVKQRSFGFSFVSDGSDVIIYFDGSQAMDDEVPLSGLRILRAVPGADLQITHLERNPETGAVTLQWPAVTGFSYLIESSTNLINWLELADSFEPDSDVGEFIDENNNADDPERYYRVMAP